MMSYNRSDYSSAVEWLSILRQDDVWLSQLEQLQNAAPSEYCTLCGDALSEVEKSDIYFYFQATYILTIIEINLTKNYLTFFFFLFLPLKQAFRRATPSFA